MPKKDLILYTASWCKPCDELKKNLKEEDLLGLVDVVVIDDVVQELKNNIGLRSIPTLNMKGELITESKTILQTLRQL